MKGKGKGKGKEKEKGKGELDVLIIWLFVCWSCWVVVGLARNFESYQLSFVGSVRSICFPLLCMLCIALHVLCMCFALYALRCMRSLGEEMR